MHPNELDGRVTARGEFAVPEPMVPWEMKPSSETLFKIVFQERWCCKNLVNSFSPAANWQCLQIESRVSSTVTYPIQNKNQNMHSKCDLLRFKAWLPEVQSAISGGSKCDFRQFKVLHWRFKAWPLEVQSMTSRGSTCDLWRFKVLLLRFRVWLPLVECNFSLSAKSSSGFRAISSYIGVW